MESPSIDDISQSNTTRRKRQTNDVTHSRGQKWPPARVPFLMKKKFQFQKVRCVESEGLPIDRVQVRASGSRHATHFFQFKKKTEAMRNVNPMSAIFVGEWDVSSRTCANIGSAPQPIHGKQLYSSQTAYTTMTTERKRIKQREGRGVRGANLATGQTVSERCNVVISSNQSTGKKTEEVTCADDTSKVDGNSTQLLNSN